MLLLAPARAFTVKCSPVGSLTLLSKSRTDVKPRSLLVKPPAWRSPSREFSEEGMENGSISLQEWQGWGSVSSVPAMVTEVIQDLKLLEESSDAQMRFGGSGGKLQGEFKVMEDKKHRSKYEALGDSEKKLQFFSARQIACRLLGSRGYLCQKCWLAMDDCMCSKVKPCSLWSGMRFWLYMHPKDFLRQNNTGKLLWQVFGIPAATLCLFGIAEDEDIMWNAFKESDKNKVWCLYPSKTAVQMSVQDAMAVASTQCKSFRPMRDSNIPEKEDEVLHFVLIDGTWNNSAAMFKRMQERAKLVWGGDDLPCISLATGASAMHKLRPQPSWDRTCTAAAAISLLSELQIIQEFSSYGLDRSAEAVEDAVLVLLEALTARRIRKGRSITRRARHSSNIC